MQKSKTIITRSNLGITQEQIIYIELNKGYRDSLSLRSIARKASTPADFIERLYENCQREHKNSYPMQWLTPTYASLAIPPMKHYEIKEAIKHALRYNKN